MYVKLSNTQIVSRIRNEIESELSVEVKFKEIIKVPKDTGVYFIYENEELVYIGEGQCIYTRCRQYLQKGSGRTFREKLIKHKKIKDVDIAIEYIYNNCKVRYIIDYKHKKLEHLCIGLFNPIYND